MAILRTESVNKVYTVDGRPITVLEDITLSVQAGDFLVIQGASGSGKTALLSLLSGLDHPSSGSVFFEDTLQGPLIMLQVVAAPEPVFYGGQPRITGMLLRPITRICHSRSSLQACRSR